MVYREKFDRIKQLFSNGDEVPVNKIVISLGTSFYHVTAAYLFLFILHFEDGWIKMVSLWFGGLIYLDIFGSV